MPFRCSGFFFVRSLGSAAEAMPEKSEIRGGSAQQFRLGDGVLFRGEHPLLEELVEFAQLVCQRVA